MTCFLSQVFRSIIFFPKSPYLSQLHILTKFKKSSKLLQTPKSSPESDLKSFNLVSIAGASPGAGPQSQGEEVQQPDEGVRRVRPPQQGQKLQIVLKIYIYIISISKYAPQILEFLQIDIPSSLLQIIPSWSLL